MSGEVAFKASGGSKFTDILLHGVMDDQFVLNGAITAEMGENVIVWL